MSVISKKSFLNKADKQQSNWEQTTGQEAGGVLNKQDFIRQAQSAAQQRRQRTGIAAGGAEGGVVSHGVSSL